MALADVTMRELLIFEAHDAAEKLHLARIAELEAELADRDKIISTLRDALADIASGKPNMKQLV